MNIARSFNNWRKYRQTVVELDRMSNRELSDLVSPAMKIQRVAPRRRSLIGINNSFEKPRGSACGAFCCSGIAPSVHKYLTLRF